MSDQTADRRAKLEKLRELGIDPFGGRMRGVAPNAEIRAAGERLAIEMGQILAADARGPDGTPAAYRAAGRVVLFRDIGSLIFITVRDQSGDLQLGVSKKSLQGFAEEDPADHQAPPSDAAAPPDPAGDAAAPTPAQNAWKVAKLLDLGDIIGVDGVLGRTKTGELTLWVSHLRLLSKALRPPPAKWHGLTDIEQRYRKRYVDLFANPEARAVFLKRAAIIDFTRQVLRRRQFVEVETPVLQPIYGGAAARPFLTHHNTLDMDLYLRISPELYLKRCLVGGLDRVFEFSRCFRNEGISPRHNPEFTMLELYQAYGDYHDMMDICEEVIGGAAREIIGAMQIQFGEVPVDYTTPWPRRKYADLLKEHAGVGLEDREGALAKARQLGLLRKFEQAPPGAPGAPGMEQQPAPGAQAIDHTLLVNALFEELVEPHLVNPTFVIDYPAPLCPLTKRHPEDASLALRFELYINGTEIGNAYSELNDPDVQRANFGEQVAGEGDETMRVMDGDFVEALEYGMPPAGGLGIGIDRLVMLLTGSTSIRDVLLFPLQRPPA